MAAMTLMGVMATTSAAAEEETTRSAEGSGDQANGESFSPSISRHGRFVAFDSEASNLVVNDTNRSRDVFVHNRKTDTTERVSINSSGNQANNQSWGPSVSFRGRLVAFGSWAANLVANDTGYADVFVHNRRTETTRRVSVDGAGDQANGRSNYPSISDDGRYVAFLSDANDLVASDTNGFQDIFVRDLKSGTTELVSVGDSSAP